MIQTFVNDFMASKDKLEKHFTEAPPNCYGDNIEAVVGILGPDNGYTPSVERIHGIDDGDYQGTLLYVIGADDYQPYVYWFVKVYYGSCSGCDTLQSIQSDIHNESSEEVKAQAVKNYMTLALHIVQGLKRMEGDGV